MEITPEQVEKVVRYARVSREEARRALERAGGSPLDAVLALEGEGKAPSTPGGSWSTRTGAPPGERIAAPAVPPGEGRRSPPRMRSYTAREVAEALRGLALNCVKVSVDIWRGDDLLAGVPLVVCVLLFIVAGQLMLPLALVGLVLGCRYRLSGWEGDAAGVNRALDQAAQAVSAWVERARERWGARRRGGGSK